MNADDRIRALRDALESIEADLQGVGSMHGAPEGEFINSAYATAAKALQEDDEAAVGLRSPL